MRLNTTINHVQFFFETLGYLRLSSFFSPAHVSRGELAQQVARVVAGIFVVLSFIDFCFHSLPFSIKIVVNGSLIALISFIGISLLLKGIQHVLNQISADRELDSNDEETMELEEEPFLEATNNIFDAFELSSRRSPLNFMPQDKTPSVGVRRNLLPEFERALGAA